MLDIYTLEILAKEHYQDLLREAERERLARQIRGTQPPTWYDRAASRVGAALVTLGEQLQRRYGTPRPIRPAYPGAETLAVPRN